MTKGADGDQETREGGGGFACERTTHQWDAVGGAEKDGLYVWVPEEELVKGLLDAGVL
jgi:hypothetical protein